MQHHPQKEVCARCGECSVAIFLMRPPGQFEWGQNISGTEVCDNCETNMLEMMAMVKDESLL